MFYFSESRMWHTQVCNVFNLKYVINDTFEHVIHHVFSQSIIFFSDWIELNSKRNPRKWRFDFVSSPLAACAFLYAVRNWKIDFVHQTHIRQARNWMAAIRHTIHEVVSLHRCRCGQSYEQWGNQPTPPCPTCEKIWLKNTVPGKRNGRTMREQTEHLRPTSSFPP